ncbi:Panacea domain-containing protein [Enterococcus raffinosus]|uniref:DUF4065 domain-containing protein n=1 Tax=Enterococcus raffinosus TaxID=71452 RepID=A0AAW8TFC9_9ENTE|nr:type II toxin-antitoxin system antitoxin SocA domain-containing protein [Enterococcus raffinosus]MDT2525331.1 DUF4065 domain-containing protein [Enterococcus raffinosus]MDT2535924.1 DUF4065 domain-containing protein [Enterococcus raffinosus]MDT2546500.1 DUF4065 domain-containing protein [Enterococcus raffinosus]MDT2580405.1 DUF4065 domain-containing protein [Enterococcus raffinosus]MDT2592638.1 DUF4065 domain-containing protein [Enterococcus raffinosus]
MNAEYSVFDIATWFLNKESMTPKKLQKLCYYAYAWGLVFFNESIDNIENRLFPNKIEAWVHGPVIPEVYHKYSKYGYGEIEKTENTREFSPDVLDLLEQVWQIYGGYDGNQLESITHQEKPWVKAREGFGPLDRCNKVISDKDMMLCYGER